jgi:PleD family two-component response regulator
LQFATAYFNLFAMTTPLALVLYENLLPGSQLVNRLQDLGYRVQAVNDAQTLTLQALQERPMVIVVDLVAASADVCAVIQELKKNPETKHIPVIAFADLKNEKLQSTAIAAGATLVAGNDAILDQLPELLDQALQVE